MEILHSAPDSLTFISSAEHQSRTPSSFTSGPPILYHHSPSSTIILHSSDLSENPAFSKLAGTIAANGTLTDGEHAPVENERISIDNVEIWMTSENLTLWRASTSTGISLPYPSISLHATTRVKLPGKEDVEEVAALYLQVTTSDGFDDFDEASLEFHIVPGEKAGSPADEGDVGGEERKTPIQQLFEALSACADLHPDPVPDEEGGMFDAGNAEGDEDQPSYDYEVVGDATGLPPPMPGSGGWITAENVNEFFNEDRSFRGRGGQNDVGESENLGPGAGTVRQRDPDGNVPDQTDGETEGNGETKWQRTG